MKLLHTSDLHLGIRWGNHSRRDDQERVLAEILDLCDVHDVDALIVTGDIFADRVEGNHLQVARRLLERLRDHLRRGRAVFLLRGNHDPYDLFRLLRFLTADMGIPDDWPLVVADEPGIYRLASHPLQIVALPYIPPRWLQTREIPPMSTPEQQVAASAGLLAAYMEWLYQQADPSIAAIFAGHIAIGGASLNKTLDYEPGYHPDLWLDPARLPPFTSYNALGHIHLAQQVSGVSKPTWYAGAPDRLDRGEREYEPQVLLVTTPDIPGGIARVEPIFITSCTPFVSEELDGQDAVDRFCAGSLLPITLGDVVIAGIPAAARRIVEDQIHAIAPCLDLRWAREDAPEPVRDNGPESDDVPGTFAAYLEQAFPANPGRRVRLMDAFTELWTETITGDTSAG
jgi:exonuclease SbcD